MKRVCYVWILVPLIFSCATYNKSMSIYYADLKAHNYGKALKNIEKNKFLNKERNALLYNLEMGKLYRLQHDYVNSNKFLNVADNLLESNRKKIGDIALTYLVNPLLSTYRGEDFEQFMLHYYKVLNYAALGKTEDAIVEARRITLATDAQNDKYKNKNGRYYKDAFTLNLQGMVYEMGGDVNNAFISYRNAADIYSNVPNDYYGVTIPAQLQKDLVRTAAQMGFLTEQQAYEKRYNIKYISTDTALNELVLFIEQGHVPVKEESNFYLTTSSNGLGSFNYLDANGIHSNLNFDYTAYGFQQEKLIELRAIKVSLPKYIVQYPKIQDIAVSLNGKSYTVELVENLNNIAVNILKERFVTEMANAVARQLTKKLVEKGAQAAVEAIARTSEKRADTLNAANKKVGNQNIPNNPINGAQQAGEIAGFLINMINVATEKADTRNWQSLPAFVSYIRIPLNNGENLVTITINGKTETIKAQGRSGLQLMGIHLD